MAIYLLLCGQYLFNGSSDKEILDNIINFNVTFNSTNEMHRVHNLRGYFIKCK